MTTPTGTCVKDSRTIYQETYDKCMGTTDKSQFLKNEECEKKANEKADAELKDCKYVEGGQNKSGTPSATPLITKLKFIAGGKDSTVLEEGKAQAEEIAAKKLSEPAKYIETRIDELENRIPKFAALAETLKKQVGDMDFKGAMITKAALQSLHQQITSASQIINRRLGELQTDMTKYDHVLEQGIVDSVNNSIDRVSTLLADFNKENGTPSSSKFTPVYNAQNAHELDQAYAKTH